MKFLLLNVPFSLIGTSPSDVAKEYNVSVATVYNIQKAFKEQKINGLIPKDNIPLHRLQRLPDVEAAILYTRGETNLGAEKIYDILVSEHDKYGINLCDIPHSRTIHSIIQQYGRIIKPKIKTKVRTPDFYHVSQAGLLRVSLIPVRHLRMFP